MEQMQRMMQQGRGGGQGAQPGDTPQVDTAEQVYISSLALIKMLKHGERLWHTTSCCKLLAELAHEPWVRGLHVTVPKKC